MSRPAAGRRDFRAASWRAVPGCFAVTSVPEYPEPRAHQVLPGSVSVAGV